MIKQKATIVATACMLLLSIVLLATASWAWFTLSSAPEISGMSVTLFTDRALLLSTTGEQDDFHQSINLSECFEGLAPLRPISTVDGINWFMPKYKEGTGELLDPSAYVLADPDVNMNVKLYEEGEIIDEETGEREKIMLTGKELFDAKTNGYYLSCSFWIATEYMEDVTVSLSAPNRANNNLEEWETKEPDDDENKHAAKYGSYALPSYTQDENNGEVYKIDNNAQNALRVGFMVDGDETNRFVIYEPNADKRSLITNSDGSVQKPSEENGYVFDYAIGDEFVDGNYIPTRPIAAVKDGDGNVTGGQISSIDPDNLIVQGAGVWDIDRVQADVAAGNKPNSNDVLTFGQFVPDNSKLSATDATKITDSTSPSSSLANALASDTQIVELKAREADGTLNPQKITMYIWIEGQDVDCWNDIANGTFMLNLEFAAQETKNFKKDGSK